MIQKFNDFLNENNTEKKFKKLPPDIKFIVASAEKICNEDNFEEGEIGKSTSMDLSYGIKGKMFYSIDELAKAADLSADYNKWSVLDNRILCSTLEDEDGNEVDTKSDLYKEFEAGENNLYACTYDFYIKIVKIEKVEDKELADLLGAQLS
jgi:hypothetical protein